MAKNVKFKYFFKCITVLMIVISYMCNVYAIAISDNDGSAFISKAEFDSKKNDFQSRLNTTLTSIDVKIEDAIASYLENANADKQGTYLMPYKDWKTVTSLNFDYGNSWKPFDFNLTYIWYDYISRTDGWLQNLWAFVNLVHKRDETSYQKVNLCDAGSESSTNPEYVFWEGRAEDYRDSITITLIPHLYYYNVNINNIGREGHWFSFLGDRTLVVVNWAKFICGYYENLNEAAEQIWQIGFYNDYWSPSSRRLVNNTTYFSKNVNTGISLNSVNDVKISYPHIIHYKKIDNMRFCDEDWTHHLSENPILTRNDLSYDDPDGFVGKWGGTEYNSRTSENPTAKPQSNVNGLRRAYESDSDSAKIPTIGLIGRAYDSSHIYQTSTKFKQVLDTKTYTSNEIPKLLDGFICFAANKDDEVMWKPKFKNTMYGDDILTIAANEYELNVCLSTSPFGDENSSSDIIPLIINKGLPNEATVDYLETNNRTCTLNFKMPKDGIVYCKWWPSDSSIKNKYWQADLDVENSKTYTRKYK